MQYIYGTYAYIANKDCSTALKSYNIEEYAAACLYAQQSIEKYLKQELLIIKPKDNIEGLLKRHSLQAIVRYLGCEDLNGITNCYDKITNLYFETRYLGTNISMQEYRMHRLLLRYLWI